MGVDGRVEDGGGQALVLGEQVVGELVEVADAADAGGAGDGLVGVAHQLGEQADVLGVALDEPVARVAQ